MNDSILPALSRRKQGDFDRRVLSHEESAVSLCFQYISKNVRSSGVLNVHGFYLSIDSGYVTYIWPCFVIWGLDRFLRFIRLLAFNISATSVSGPESIHAQAELVTPDLVRLTMQRPKHFRWHAGQTAYLILPTVSTLPFEAHPFTIASYDAHMPGSKEEEDKVPRMWKDVVFLINIREGFTKRLGEAAIKGEKVTALIDGPYGPAPQDDHFDTIVLIAGTR